MDGHGPASGPPPGIPYSGYGQPQALQPAAPTYQSAGYPQYQYPNTMAPMTPAHPVTSTQMVGPSQPLPAMMPGPNPPPNSSGAPAYQPQQSYDTTGQLAPPGMKPRVTATLWEDEGSLCFQVEANGVCVARREDNHMINGTKLLNVAGMTRGRRDGILKSEKTRHVVKIGPMHLKGVWIPFDRALDFANKEKITEALYPLFVHNIGALLYHPTNQQARSSIGNAAMAARRPDQPQQDYLRTPQGTQAPSLTHHHSMATPISQAPHSIAPQPTPGRPGIDRAHTFPTPPTSASSMMGMGNAGGAYDYNGTAMHSGQPLAVENGISARSVPTTPATTPPGNQGIQYHTTQPYDSQRQIYSTPSQHGNYYAQQPQMGRYGPLQSSPGGAVKSEMGPPARAGAEEHSEAKPHEGYGGQPDAEGEHEGEYTHTSASFGAERRSPDLSADSRPGTIHSDPSHISPEMTHSPHQNGSGRATPRTTATYTGAYNSTPQRSATLPSSNLNYVMSNDSRAGAPNGSEYPSQHYPSAAQYPSMNGAGTKRGRDLDDQEDASMKRQRTDPVRPISQPVKAGGMRR